MAQLTNTTINGTLNVTNDVTISSGKMLKFNRINAPTSSGVLTYGPGTSGQVLKSNGTTVYWGDNGDSNIIDLGTTTESADSTTNSLLNSAVNPGIYTFKIIDRYNNTQPFLMKVSKNDDTGYVYQSIQTTSGYCLRSYEDEEWVIDSGTYATQYMTRDYPKNAASGDTSNKIYLIGRTSQTTYGGTTYSHDTVYVDTDGHLYDSGNKVATVADIPSNNGGGMTMESIYNALGDSSFSITNWNQYKFFILCVSGYSDINKYVIIPRSGWGAVYYNGNGGNVDYVSVSYNGNTATFTNHGDNWGAWGFYGDQYGVK